MKQIQIIGNIGREPEIKTRSNGKDYMIFSVAVSTSNGAEWYGICAPNLEKIRPYLTRGRMVFVQGTPSFSVYRELVDITIFADSVQLCGGGRDDRSAESVEPQAVAQATPDRGAPSLPTIPTIPVSNDLPY